MKTFLSTAVCRAASVTPEVEGKTAIINDPNGYSYLNIGGAEETRIPDRMLAKPSASNPLWGS